MLSDRRAFFKISGSLSLAWLLAACDSGTQPIVTGPSLPRIGFLTATGSNTELDLLKNGLKDVGYVDGQTITLDARLVEPDQLQETAEQLMRLPVKVLIAADDAAARAARTASDRIPILFAESSDPVSAGFVQNLARPGGNLTGLRAVDSSYVKKWFQLLHDTVPGLARVAVLWTGPVTDDRADWDRAATVAATFYGLSAQSLEAQDEAALDAALADAQGYDPSAMMVLPTPSALAHGPLIPQKALMAGMPTLFAWRDSTDLGGLMAYGPSPVDRYRRLAGYLDKVLKGESPALIPVELPTRFDLALNLKTAEALKLGVPATIVSQATAIIR
jgi:putative ABC transport system substrate-binding protein